MELLPREEVALLLGTLTACGFLLLGVLEFIWPTASSRRASPRSSSKAPAVPPPAPAAKPPAPLHVPRPLPPLPPPPHPLSVGKTLLERARAEGDLERRVTILTRAVAGLTRSLQATPDDAELAATLASARTFLWETWEKIALARLAAAMPWGTTQLAAPSGVRIPA